MPIADRPPQPPLLEREAEIAAIQGLVAAARGGAGRLLVIEGGSGIGKTRLLGEAGRAARAAGLEVLAARAGELEQEFAFGVIRQLFEPLLVRASAAERAELTAGAAGLALPLFQEPQAVGPAAADPSFAMLHGLYWLAANLALRRPVLVAVDDLHWADGPSLRWLAYLGRRLEGLPLLAAVAARPPEQSPQAALLTEVLTDPAAELVRPGPLGTAAVASLARDAFGGEPDPALVAACQTATGGNPLFVHAMLEALAGEGLTATAADADRVLRTGPETVGRAVLLRLARLPTEAAALLRAAAVLGDGSRLHQAGELAGLETDAAARAATALVRADLLRAEDPVEFTHPVVRTTVYQQLGADERSRAHRRVGELLLQAGAPAEQAASHLLPTLPAGDRFVAATLRRAAERSLAEGAAQAAIPFLRRALLEGAAGGDPAGMLRELGIAELATDAFAAAEHLREAAAATGDPTRRAEIALQQGRALAFLDRFDDAVEVLMKAVEGLGGRRTGLHDRLEAILYTLSLARPDLHRLAVKRIEEVPEAALGDDLGGAVLRAVLAYHEACRGGSRDRCVALAERALDGGRLLRSVELFWVLNVTVALTCAGEFERAAQVNEQALAEARRRGDLLSVTLILMIGGFLAAQRGDLLAAEEDLRASEPGSGIAAVTNPLHRAGYLADVLVDRGAVEDAGRLLDAVSQDAPAHAAFHLLFLYGRGRVRLHAGRPEEALGDLLAVGEEMAALSIANPAFLPWRSQAALALHRLGRRSAALRLAQKELELARRWKAPRAVGVALRVLGLVQGGSTGEAVLREAATLLEGSGAQLEHARVLVDLGAALRRGNRRGEARAPLRRGLELAYRAGAAGLVRQAQDELAAMGARPRKLLLTGVESLTPSERRVARMAAQGMSNKELAQTLFVTVKAVEVHLSSVYRKLQISSRTQLARALADANSAVPAPRS
jgi:DNA-binding CsgD family transcriptional regulator